MQEGTSYADVLRQVKFATDDCDKAEEINKIIKTKNEKLLMTLNRATGAKELAEATNNNMEKAAVTHKIGGHITTDLTIREEAIQTIEKEIHNTVRILVGQLRRSREATQAIIVRGDSDRLRDFIEREAKDWIVVCRVR